MAVSKAKLGANNPFVRYLDHDHRQRENIRFFAICPLLVQNLWRSVSRGVTSIIHSALYGIQVLSDCSKTKIGDSCTIRGIYKDV